MTVQCLPLYTSKSMYTLEYNSVCLVNWILILAVFDVISFTFYAMKSLKTGLVDSEYDKTLPVYGPGGEHTVNPPQGTDGRSLDSIDQFQKKNQDRKTDGSLQNENADSEQNSLHAAIQQDKRYKNLDVLPPMSGVQRRFPQAIIIGFPKCGTGALREFLDLHSDIVVARPQPNYFKHNFHLGSKYYLAKLPPSAEGQVTVDKTASYVFEPEAARRIYAMNASVRLIVATRNPVQRVISRHAEFNEKHGQNLTLQQRLMPHGVVDWTCSFIKQSRYIEHLHHWLDVFPRSQIHVVNSDSFSKHPLKELTAIETFLGIRHNISAYNVVYNEEKGFHCLRSWQGKLRCLGSGKGRPHPHVDPRLLQKLENHYRSYNQKFNKAFGVNFGWPV